MFIYINNRQIKSWHKINLFIRLQPNKIKNGLQTLIWSSTALQAAAFFASSVGSMIRNDEVKRVIGFLIVTEKEYNLR